MTQLILASQSKARQAMLKGAGLSFKSKPADVDEGVIKTELLKKGANQDQIASRLAAEKARFISTKHTDSLVIGSDQILSFEGRTLSKAKDKDEAFQKLKALNGKTHRLISSVAIFQDGQRIWDFTDHADLTMHSLSDEFLASYCAQAGDVLTSCVGAYALEEHGSWLFSKIEGDFYTILGMPLLPLLSYLRSEQGFSP